MAVKKLEDGRYEVDVRPRGRDGKRIRKKFDRKTDAHAYERSVISKYQNKDYLNRPADKRRLSELIALWWHLIGRNKRYATRLLSAVNGICNDMGDPMVYQINTKSLVNYRGYRLGQGIKASTINHDLFIFSSMLNSLTEIDEYHNENPVNMIKPLKEDKAEMTYLIQEEIERLLEISSGDYYRIAVLLLATGARWGEAYALKSENIIGNRVVFTLTKNGSRRVVPVSDDVISIVRGNKSGRLFSVSYATFRRLMKKAKPNLPDGQAAHALRHTFATHFMMKGGNIIALQRILGHADISQTMVYAHFAPDYLLDAVNYNPLNGVSTIRPH
ncbi:tyrosine-type recombinase/integrase [Salmonella enterica]|nr:integrase [Salmonella enterica subsp. enterica serovar Panama]EHN6577480.1 tyrosine-type recombinase/integrase [Salmonella enterica subsp. enterica serovar Anecho]